MTTKSSIACRICLEDSSAGMLENPCKCTGSLSYVHEECLKTWLMSKGSNLEDSKCEICQTNFLMKFSKRLACSPIYACKTDISICFFIVLLSFVLAILLTITYILISSLVLGLDTKDEYYFSMVLLSVCGISISIILYLMVNSIKEICFRVKVEKWKIYDQIADNYLITEDSAPMITSINGRKISSRDSKDTSRGGVNDFDCSELNEQFISMYFNNKSDN